MSLSVIQRQKLHDPRFNRGDGKAVTPASLRERCSSKGARDSCRPDIESATRDLEDF